MLRRTAHTKFDECIGLLPPTDRAGSLAGWHYTVPLDIGDYRVPTALIVQCA